MDIAQGLRALWRRGRRPMKDAHAPPRLCPERPLPPYAFVPRHFPHPVRDPRGHSFQIPPDFGPVPDPDAPLESAGLRYACDLFNFGYYWESHEAFEAYWQGCGEGDPRRETFQGLLRLAAAGVKARGGQGPGVASHAQKAAALFRGVADALGGPEARILGLSPSALASEAQALALKAYTFEAALPMPQAEAVLALRLLPAAEG